MTPPIVIIIQDHDRFFVQGLKHILQMHFWEQGRTVNFAPITDGKTADLIIRSESTSWPIQMGGLWRFLYRNFPRVLIIRDRVSRERRPLPCCQNKLSVIRRHERPNVVIQRVAHLLDVRHSANLSCTCCTRILTPRQREVLQAISAELSPQQVASKLAIHVKTVSTHKTVAMRKLGFRHNHELYHWLRCGGLEFEIGRLPAVAYTAPDNRENRQEKHMGSFFDVVNLHYAHTDLIE